MRGGYAAYIYYIKNTLITHRIPTERKHKATSAIVRMPLSKEEEGPALLRGITLKQVLSWPSYSISVKDFFLFSRPNFSFFKILRKRFLFLL